MNYWLMKSEPGSYSIDHLKRDGSVAWEGVRNYQARNHMQTMKKGDLVLFYHSSADQIGVAGIAKVSVAPHPDMTQFNEKSHYFEPRATKEKPVWYCVDISFVKKFKEVVPLAEMKLDPKLSSMMVTSKASRLSVQPVSAHHFEHITKELAP